MSNSSASWLAVIDLAARSILAASQVCMVPSFALAMLE